MTSPQEKYENDSSYRMLVEMLESFIHKCQYSPSELREAALLACIRYESLTIRPRIMVLENQAQGYYDQASQGRTKSSEAERKIASQGWIKFNEAERKIASQAKEIERLKDLCAELIGPDLKKEGE